MKKLIIVCIFLVCGFSYLNALITQWTGNTDTAWNTPTNWSDGLPDATHSVIIPSSVTSGNWPTYSTGSSTCYEVANYGTLNITGGQLNAAYDFTSATGSSTTLSGHGGLAYGQIDGDFNCDGTVNVNDNATLSGKDFISSSGSTVNLNGGYFSIDGDFDADGTVNIDDAAVYATNFLVGGTVNQYGGSINVMEDMNNSGNFNQTGGTTNVTETLTNSGVLYNHTAQCTIGIAVINDPDGTWENDGGDQTVEDFTNQGTFIQTSGTTDVNGTLLNDTGGSFGISAGYVDIGHGTFNGTLNQSGGTLNVNNNLVFGGSSSNTQSGGSFTAESGGTFDPNSVLNISGNASFQYKGDFNCNGVVTVDGGTLWAGGSSDPNFVGGATSQIDLNSGYFSINSYATSGVTNVQGGEAYWSSATNNGTFNLSSGTANTYAGFTNNGTYNQTGGTASFNGGFTLSSTSTNTQSGGTLNIGGDASFSSSFINTGSNGEIVFNGGTTQSVTNPTTFPNTNMIPNLKVNNNSTVVFDEKTSFAAGNVEVNSGTLDIGSGFLEPTSPGMGNWAVGANSEIIIGGNNTLPNYGTNNFDPSSKVTYNSTTHSQAVKGITYPILEVSGTTKMLAGNTNVSQALLLNTLIDVGNYNLTLLNGATLTPGSNSYVATTGSGYLIKNNVSSGDFPIGPDVSNYNGFSFDNNGVALTSIGARVETGITPTHPNAMYCLQRTWDIIKEGILYADFAFYWLQTQETQPFEQARVNSRIVGHLCHTPPSWQVISTPSGATGTGMLGDPYKVDFGDIAIVSGFCLGDGDHTLPVQLSSFNAVYSNESGLEFVQVNWATSTETDVLGYNVYQSTTDEFDDAMKINAGLIPGQGTTTVGHSYSYDDLDADIDLRNYYWIEQMDYSGLSELFGPAVYIPESGGEPGPDDFTETLVLQHYPNPVENNMKIEYQIKGSADQQDVVIYIYNMKGEYIDTVFGQNGSAEIDLSRYATGVYFYRLQDTSFGETYKFVVIR